MTEQRNLFQRVLDLMNDLKYISKGSNKVNGQYTFVSHDAVASKVHPYLVKHGIVVIPTVDELKQENNRTCVKLSVSFINADNPQEFFTTCYWGYGIDGGDKGPGKAISYAYKYALLKTFCLETGDDPDNDATATYEPEKCLDFDAAVLPHIDKASYSKLDDFLKYSAEALSMHVEDVKREAVNRTESFLKKFSAWKPKGKK